MQSPCRQTTKKAGFVADSGQYFQTAFPARPFGFTERALCRDRAYRRRPQIRQSGDQETRPTGRPALDPNSPGPIARSPPLSAANRNLATHRPCRPGHWPAETPLTFRFKQAKSFRKVVWKADQQAWARLHEEAFMAFGGSVAYVVLDNLKQGVIRPDLYAPELNPVYAAVLAHYGVVADPARVADPDRKGTVENAIQHTQSTGLKGRKFDAIEAQNAHLAHWEERWAAPRIHGRKKRQVLAMFAEEQPYLKALPAERFRFFKQEVRTVDDAGLVQVNGAYYAALPAPLHTRVTVRIYEQQIELLDEHGAVLRRHAKAARRGQFVLPEADRLFNPSRETARLIGKVAKIGPASQKLAREIFARLGRPGQRALYGLANLARHYSCEAIEAACTQVLTLATPSYQALKRVLERRDADARAAGAGAPVLMQSGADIRAIEEYQAFFEQHSKSVPPSP